MISPDLIFSYWIDLWFILHFLGFIKPSPKAIFVIALVFNLVQTAFFFAKGLPTKYVVIFFIMVLLMKVFPLWLMRNEPIRRFDLLLSAGLIVIYMVYLWIRGKGIGEVYREVNESIIAKRNETPFFRVVHSFEKVLK